LWLVEWYGFVPYLSLPYHTYSLSLSLSLPYLSLSLARERERERYGRERERRYVCGAWVVEAGKLEIGK
jgi:hypothetical protein